MEKLFEEYCRIFFECWDNDAKDIYRDVDGLQDRIRKELLQDMIGFCATTSLFRCVGPFILNEYSSVEDSAKRARAVCLAMIFDRSSLLKRGQYGTVGEWVRELASTDELYSTYTAAGL